MRELEERLKNTGALHHAYVLVGDRAPLLDELKRFIESTFGMAARANPDVMVQEFETFGIGESRFLSDAQTKRALTGGRKCYIVAFKAITAEAQNALLKVLEEPTAGTHFFLLMPDASSLLATLRSRVEIFEFKTSGAVADKDKENQTPKGVAKARAFGGLADGAAVEKFLKAPPAGRTKLLQPLIDAKDKQGAVDFLNALEGALYRGRSPRDFSEEDIFVFEEIDRTRDYLRDRAPSVKMLLEHIAAIA